MTKEEKVTVNFLKNKLVIVKAIHREGKWATLLAQDIKDSNMFPGAKRGYTVPFQTSTNSLVQIFENTTKYKTPFYDDPITEQEFFERQLGLEKGAMNPYAKDCFWKKDVRSRVVVPKEGITLNLSNPVDYVKYSILKANKHLVAPSWKERFKSPEYMFAICDDDSETDSRLDEMEMKLKVIEAFSRVTKDKESMIDFLKVKGEVVPKIIKESKIKADIFQYSNDNPKQFLRIADDPNFEIKVFIADAIRAGSITKLSANEYELNGVIIANSEAELIKWIHDPENSKAKIKIKHQIENSK